MSMVGRNKIVVPIDCAQKLPLNIPVTFPVMQKVWRLECVFSSIHTLCMRSANVLASLRICAGSSEHSLPDNAISTNIS